MPVDPIGSLGSFIWAGSYLCFALNGGFYVWVRPGWAGPFGDIAAMELAASERGFG